jgi:tetratricopeptide (TPR) repeat protein
MNNKEFKFASISWLIFGVIGFFYALSTNNHSKDLGIMIFCWVSNGIFWGWLLGYLIDKLRFEPNAKPSMSNYDSMNKKNMISRDFINRGGQKASSGDYRGAIADFNRAIDLDPNDENTYYLRAMAKSALNDYAGVVYDLTKGLEIDPDEISFYFLRGSARIQIKDFKGAISDLTKVIQSDPNNDMAYYNRGIARLASGITGSGYDDLIKAREMGVIEAKNILEMEGIE